MKTLVVFLSLTFFLIAGSGLSLAAAEAPKTDKPANAVVNYNPKYKCVMVCKGEKPVLEVSRRWTRLCAGCAFGPFEPYNLPDRDPGHGQA